MKKSLPMLSLALAVAVATPAFSQIEETDAVSGFASDAQVIPTMANGAGVGTVFATHVAIMNPTTSAFTVTATFYDATGATKTGTIPLAAGELKTFTNFVQSVFNTSGAGAVTLASPESVGGTHNNRFIVSAEVYTTTDVRFGTTVPVLEFPGSDSRSFAAGIWQDANTRTNVGCFDQSGAANPVRYTVFDASGREVGANTINLPARAWGQVPVGTGVIGGYVVFAPAGQAVCWAVVVENSTNDGRFILATEYAP